jgi:hypothetical protein
VPQLDILDRKAGRLRWDAASLILSTIIVPDDTSLRSQYAAALRLQTANGRPDGEQRLTRPDKLLAGKFERRPRIEQIMQTRRLHSSLAGAMLWDLYTAAEAHPELVSKNKIEFTIDRISIAKKKLGSKATLRKAWRQFRPVLHWCAAMAYQSRVFQSVFPQYPEIGYVGDVVISDFLALGEMFMAFAKEHVEFQGRRPAFWVASSAPTISTRRPDWPDAHILMEGFELRPEFLDVASRYVVERDGLERPWVTSRPARRSISARRSAKNPK